MQGSLLRPALLGVAVAICGCVFRPSPPAPATGVEFESEAAGPLRVGAARQRMTPKPPVLLAGGIPFRVSTGIHDDLWARAVVLDNGARRVALVALDLIGVDQDDVQVCREAVAKRVDADYVLIAATHTHSAPDLIGAWNPLPFPYEQPYLQQVADAVATAVAEAQQALEPASIRVAVGSSGEQPLIRDTRPPKLLDDTLTVWQARTRKSGRVIATVVHFASHPIAVPSLNFDVSSDFADSLRRALEQGFQSPIAEMAGYGGVALFFNGPLGGRLTPANVHYDLASRNTRHAFRRSVAYGRQVALRASHLLETNTRTLPERLPIAVRSHAIIVPLQNTMLLLATSAQLIKRPIDAGGVRSEVAMVQIGPLAFFAIPGMTFPELARDAGALRPAGEAAAGANPGHDASEGSGRPHAASRQSRERRVQGDLTWPGADHPDAPLEGPLETLAGDAIFIPIGLANDMLGYIIPRRQWDTAPPFTTGGLSGPYGEAVSPGPETARVVFEAFRDLCAPSVGVQPASPAPATP